jgi:hypothetical protein
LIVSARKHNENKKNYGKGLKECGMKKKNTGKQIGKSSRLLRCLVPD